MTSNRKDDHVNEAAKQFDRQENGLDQIRFVHHSLSHKDIEAIDTQTQILGHNLRLPFYINAMTGGSEWTKQVNKQLAMVAKETGLMMAPGSISAALKDPNVADSFKIVREVNPDGFVLANLGANHGLENAKRAVDLIQANAFQIHLNIPQEIVMPEGDRHFSEFLDHVDEIVNGLDVPVMVKEVGFGMSQESLALLYDIGVKTVDISGYGGTNFATIENSRRPRKNYAFMEDWGQSTAISLLESLSYQDRLDIVASGGIKSPLHMVKALALGAKAVAMSGEFLRQILYQGVDQAIEQVAEWEEQIKLLMLMLDASQIADLQNTDLVISPELYNWTQQRHIDISQLSQRSHKKSI